MFDPLSTLFSAVQRESHNGVIGKQAYDRATYEVLHGTGEEQPAPRRRAVRMALALSALGTIAVVLYWLAQL